MRGMGKTYLSVKIAEKLAQKGGYVLLIDPTGAYEQYPELRRFKNLGIFEVDILEENKINAILSFAFSHKGFVIIDEASEFPFSKYGLLRDLVMRARNWGCGYLAISRASAELHKAYINNSTYTFIFYLRENNALKYLEQNLDVDRQEITSLKKYEFIIAYYSQIMRQDGKALVFVA
jgi:hypothetical protein